MSYKKLAESLKNSCPSLILKENQPLSAYTTFKIGGNCPLMAFPESQESFLLCITEAKKANLPCIPLGNGSNLLVSDEGYSGFFLNTKEFQQLELEDDNKIIVSSGVLLGKLANFAFSHSLTGLEFAQGIPGTVGGGIVMNAGAYGGEMCQVIESVTSFDLETETLITRTVNELDFSYRHSLFSGNNEVILSSTLRLSTGNPEEIQEKMKTYANSRREKQPLDFPSCGSTFKRPTGHFAAALIDQCGLKGFTVGGAQVSEKHAGFVVNIGSATCNDVLSLTNHVKETVLKETGVTLELEVQILA